MKCLALRHVAFEDLGVFEEVLSRRGYEVAYRQAGVQHPSAADWDGADLVIVLGGPIGVNDQADYPWLRNELAAVQQRLQAQRPLLGICLGAQLMACALGARVFAGPAKEIGWAPVQLSAHGAASPLRHLAGQPVLHWHGDTFDLPPDATRLASTALTPNQAFSVGRSALALQFHPEIDAARFEAWLIGHTVELAAVGADIAALRSAAAMHNSVSSKAFFEEWLDTAVGTH